MPAINVGYDKVLIFLLLCLLQNASSSDGDRSPFYQKCLIKCIDQNCTSGGYDFKPTVKDVQPLCNRLLMWGCDEDCRYICMWRTVHALDEHGWPPVKFHGKWPFVRVLGMQEPGSVVGSLLNLAAHLFMYNKLRVAYSGRNTPLLWLWTTFFAVCVHGWLWSTIFHARDTPFTEFMDYSCALSMVIILFIASVVRLAYGKSTALAAAVTGASVLYYITHVQYLYAGIIDYEYNMAANIVPGCLTVVLWTIWAVKRQREYPYTRLLLLFNLLALLFLALELLDFPPYLFLWDAHALWHMSTSILPLIFYRFVYNDLMYLRQSWPETLKSDTKIC